MNGGSQAEEAVMTIRSPLALPLLVLLLNPAITAITDIEVLAPIGAS
jgi:hypothetical protein